MFLVLRSHPLGPMLGAYNVTAETRRVPLGTLQSVGLDTDAYDHMAAQPCRVDHGTVVLPPYAAARLTATGG